MKTSTIVAHLWGRVYAHKICSLACEKVIQNQKLWWINFRDGVLEIILEMYASRITELHSLYPNVAIYYTRCNRMSKVHRYSSAPHHMILRIFNWWANLKTIGTQHDRCHYLWLIDTHHHPIWPHYLLNIRENCWSITPKDYCQSTNSDFWSTTNRDFSETLECNLRDHWDIWIDITSLLQ